MTMKQRAFENIDGKEKNAGNQHFLFLPTMFSTLSKIAIIILATLNLMSANAFNLVKVKLLSFGKEFSWVG